MSQAVAQTIQQLSTYRCRTYIVPVLKRYKLKYGTGTITQALYVVNHMAPLVKPCKCARAPQYGPLSVGHIP
jgi:hypothetical protein